MEERSIESACAMWDNGTINIFVACMTLYGYVCYMAWCIINVIFLHTIQSVKETQRIHLEHGQQKDARR